ncbi:GMC oxidoreductase [Nocardia sp. NPDC003482]
MAVRSTADVVVIGHGLTGAVVARTLRDAGVEVLIVDGGTQFSARPATHLRNLAVCRTDRALYAELVAALLRPVSVPPAQRVVGGAAVPGMPDGRGVNRAQRPDRALPAARATATLGGMSTLWNCLAPRPNPDLEWWPGLAVAEWTRLFERAEDLLGVGTDLAGASRRHAYVLKTLGEQGLITRHIPVAARVTDAGIRWTGPAEVVGDAPITLRRCVIRRLLRSGERITGVEAIDLPSGEAGTISADAFVVAAGPLRTPALLHASNVVRDNANLGRYLCDHPLAHTQVLLDPDLRENGAGVFVETPRTADRPFHGVLLSDGHDSAVLEGGVDDRLLVSLYWYCALAPRYDNRVVFHGGASDSLGSPQPTLEYALDASDRAITAAALADLRAVAAPLGPTLPVGPPRLTSPGTSQHIMGTTRMGADDRDSVVDDRGRVWGTRNLYLAGTGLIRGATAANPTLTACALAVRTAESIARPARTT